MAINPIFGSQLPDLTNTLGAQPSVQTATNAPTVLTPEQLSAQAAEVLLSDLNANTTGSTTGDFMLSMLDSSGTSSAFNSLTGASTSTGDPLLDDLNAMDAGLQTNGANGIESSLGQGLTSFLLQQAKASFQASQAMDSQGANASSGGKVLGDTKA